jgi:hypothetical protein
MVVEGGRSSSAVLAVQFGMIPNPRVNDSTTMFTTSEDPLLVEGDSTMQFYSVHQGSNSDTFIGISDDRRHMFIHVRKKMKIITTHGSIMYLCYYAMPPAHICI